MNVTAQVKARVEKIVKDCVDKAGKHFGRTYDVPRIEYTVRGTKGGYAQGTHLVNFNAILLMENLEDYLTSTVPHEVAHIIDSANGNNMIQPWQLRNGRRLKRSVHGPSWVHIMRLFGADPSRCHEYDVSNAQVKKKQKFEYQCSGCKKSIFITSVIHNKMQAGQVRWCGKCGRGRGTLTFISRLGKVTFSEAREIVQKRAAQNPAPPVTSVRKIPALPVEVVANAIEQLRSEKGCHPPTKLDGARNIYRMYGHLGRSATIDKMVNQLGLKATTASTYYSVCKARK